MIKKRLLATFIILLVILISVLVMIVPSFFTQGVSRVVLNKELNLPLVLDDEKDIKLVFFGYAGCVDVCTPRLFSINEIYISLDEQSRKRVGVEFLDISTPVDKTLSSDFAKFFNSEFKGIYLPKDILNIYTRAFEVYYSKSLIYDGEFDHTAHLYLVKKINGKKEIRYIYNSYPYDAKQIKLDIKELLNG